MPDSFFILSGAIGAALFFLLIYLVSKRYAIADAFGTVILEEFALHTTGEGTRYWKEHEIRSWLVARDCLFTYATMRLALKRLWKFGMLARNECGSDLIWGYRLPLPGDKIVPAPAISKPLVS